MTREDIDRFLDANFDREALEDDAREHPAQTEPALLSEERLQRALDALGAQHADNMRQENEREWALWRTLEGRER